MKLVLEARIAQPNNVQTFIFRPQEPITWIAGQSIKIAVQGKYGPLEHRFTIAAAPYEQKIAISTRNSGSAYKQTLFALTTGDAVDGFAIEGAFTWQEGSLPKLLVAAGIGITPYYAMLKQRVYEGKDVAATLLYGIPSADILYKKELEQWCAEYPLLDIHYIVGERITPAHFAYQGDLHRTLIYLAGPSGMVETVGDALLANGVPPQHLVRDWFLGRLPDEGYSVV